MSDTQNSRRRAKSKGPSLAPLYGAVGLAIMAILAVALAKNDDEARKEAKQAIPQNTEPVSNPFAGVVNNGRTPTAKGEPTKSTTPASASLLSNPIWVQALADGKLATERLKEAKEKDSAGKRKEYKTMAVEARDLFDKALDDTAYWELEIIDTHGESDSWVAKVQSQRTIWNVQRKKLRKVDVNDL